jgi:hypothetical protein
LSPFYKKKPTNSGQNTSNIQRRTDYHQKRRENPKVSITIFGTYPSFFEYLTALVRISGVFLVERAQNNKSRLAFSPTIGIGCKEKQTNHTNSTDHKNQEKS